MKPRGGVVREASPTPPKRVKNICIYVILYLLYERASLEKKIKRKRYYEKGRERK